MREASQDDPTLGAEVESLLDAHARAGYRGMASPFDALDSSAISSLAQVLKSGECLGLYEILTPLGFGGMGEVYKARDTRLNRIVAIKVLSAPIGGDAESRARFLREAQAVAALNHPHICTVHDVGCCAVPRRPEPIDFLGGKSQAGEHQGAIRRDGQGTGLRLVRRTETPSPEEVAQAASVNAVSALSGDGVR